MEVINSITSYYSKNKCCLKATKLNKTIKIITNKIPFGI